MIFACTANIFRACRSSCIALWRLNRRGCLFLVRATMLNCRCISHTEIEGWNSWWCYVAVRGFSIWNERGKTYMYIEWYKGAGRYLEYSWFLCLFLVTESWVLTFLNLVESVLGAWQDKGMKILFNNLYIHDEA